MSIVINIRGTNGSGKSTIARAFIESPDSPTFLWPGAYAYVSSEGVCVLGKYTTACGGMDTVKTQMEAHEMVRYAADRYPVVIFEGVLISGIFTPWLKLSRSMDTPIRWAFLDTPADVCVARVQARRDARGDTRPYNEKLLRDKHTNTANCRLRFLDALEPVYDLPWQNPVPVVHQIITGEYQHENRR